MRSELDAIVSVLSVRLFEIPEACVLEAREISESDPDRSLVDALFDLGHLKVDERATLDSLSAELRRHDFTTLDGGGAVSALSTLAQMRDTADRLRTTGRRYEERGEQARGGMGRILRVWDRQMHREVALKEVLPARGTHGGRVVARFLREARITGRLQHPSIVPVHEIGVRENGTFYYTMKLVRGQTLRHAIKGAPSIGERLALLPHFLNLCQAVAYAHAHGVIHRDLKPSNVMIGEFGETQVIDWGLAKDLLAEREADASAEWVQEESESGEGGELTQAGQLLGTPHYMAPEQAMGRHEALDARADVYSLGAVLYELLTGERPYRASSGLEVLRQCAEGAPVPPEALCPSAPAPLIAICRRAMARDPQARYPSARELASEIATFQAGARVSAYDYGVGELLARFLRRHRPVVVTGALALALLSGLGAYSYLSLRARHAAELDLRVKSEQKGYDLSILLAQGALEEYRYKEAATILAACPPEYRDWEWGELSGVLDGVLRTGQTPQAQISEARISPDGKRLVTTGRDGSVSLTSLPEMRLIRNYEPVPGEPWHAAISPDGREFAVHSAAGVVTRMDMESPAILASYPFEFASDNDGLAYSPDGQFLAAGGAGPSIFEWNLANGGTLSSLPVEGKLINDLAYSPDGRWLAAGTDSGRLQVWDRQSRACILAVDAHTTNLQNGTQGVLNLAFSPDGSLLATSGCDATAKLWEVATWSVRHTLAGHTKKVMNIAFSPDCKTLCTTSERNLKLWNTRTGLELPSRIRTPVGIRRAIFLPDGQSLLTADTSSGLSVWNLTATPATAYLEGHSAELNTVRFSLDGRYLASGAGHWMNGGDDRALLWEIGANGLPAASPRVLQADGGWINHLAFHPNGRWLCGSDQDSKVVAWDYRSGERLPRVPVPDPNESTRCVAFNPDGTILATTGWGERAPRAVTLWEWETGRCLQVLEGPTDIVDSIDFSPDGQSLAGGNRDGKLRVWDVATGALRWERDPGAKWIYGVAYSGDGKLLAGSCDISAVVLWDAQTGEEIRRLEGLRSRANKVTFNPTSTRVAACDDGMVKIWNVKTGAALLSLPHGSADVDFSPDGRTLATAGLDGRVGIWHAADWDATSP